MENITLSVQTACNPIPYIDQNGFDVINADGIEQELGNPIKIEHERKIGFCNGFKNALQMAHDTQGVKKVLIIGNGQHLGVNVSHLKNAVSSASEIGITIADLAHLLMDVENKKYKGSPDNLLTIEPLPTVTEPYALDQFYKNKTNRKKSLNNRFSKRFLNKTKCKKA